MSRCNPSLRATDSESRQLVYSAKRDPKVEAVAANADRLTICTRRYKAEWSEVCCFPQGHNASALVCDHDALPLEGRLTISTRRYKAEWSEVCCFPQGHNASALVCDHDALPLEGRLTICTRRYKAEWSE